MKQIRKHAGVISLVILLYGLLGPLICGLVFDSERVFWAAALMGLPPIIFVLVVTITDDD